MRRVRARRSRARRLGWAVSEPPAELLLQANRKDKDAKFHLILVESRIHRLARYYKKSKKLPPNWKYESSTASALVA